MNAPLYYFSFGNDHTPMAFKSLSRGQQARLDPMITGFNAADMYAADHIETLEVKIAGRQVPLEVDLTNPLVCLLEPKKDLEGLSGMRKELEGDAISDRRGHRAPDLCLSRN